MIKDDLIAGYKSFRRGNFVEQKLLFEELGRGQNPKVLVIACSDSRVDPAHIFASKPGDIFSVRNVANIVPPASSGDNSVAAAVQYAVTVLGVEMIMVMGHASCGGVQGCLDGMGHDPEAGAVGKWVSTLNDVRERILAKGLPADQVAFEMQLEGVRQSISNLMTFSYVKQAVEAGKLSLQGAYFSIAPAKLLLQDAQGEFEGVSV